MVSFPLGCNENNGVLDAPEKISCALASGSDSIVNVLLITTDLSML